MLLASRLYPKPLAFVLGELGEAMQSTASLRRTMAAGCPFRPLARFCALAFGSSVVNERISVSNLVWSNSSAIFAGMISRNFLLSSVIALGFDYSMLLRERRCQPSS